MSAEIIDNAEPPFESELAKLIDGFVKLHEAFLSSCGSYVEDPVSKTRDPILLAANATIEAWKQSINFILDDDDTDLQTKVKLISGLIMNTDSQRVKSFRKLLGKDDVLDEIDREKISKELADKLESDEFDLDVIVVGITNLYVHDTQSDLNKFFAIAEAIKENRKNKQRLLAKHALDVVKITAGVWLGLKLSQRASSQK